MFLQGYGRPDAGVQVNVFWPKRSLSALDFPARFAIGHRLHNSFLYAQLHADSMLTCHAGFKLLGTQRDTLAKAQEALQSGESSLIANQQALSGDEARLLGERQEFRAGETANGLR